MVCESNGQRSRARQPRVCACVCAAYAWLAQMTQENLKEIFDSAIRCVISKMNSSSSKKKGRQFRCSVM